MTRVPLSILDLVPVSAGSTPGDAFRESTALAQSAECAGYRRFWVAEHHGSEVFMASATAVILAHLGAHTSTIRLGSGGVMLPNHAPLMVAEYYGTLATLYGDRIDLGLGRAPGTDPVTASALRRSTGDIDSFAEDVVALTNWFGERAQRLPGVGGPHGRVRAIPGEGTHVPIWMLGSSLGGASVAAYLGLPFAFASHFAPEQLGEALAYYRSHFNPDAPTAQVSKPYVMAGINVVCAPTDDEAALLATTARAMAARIRSGNHGPLDPPDHALVKELPPALQQAVDAHQAVRAIGSPERVVADIEAFVERHQLDEVITTTYTWDPELRRRSYDLLAQAWGLTPA